MKFYMSWFFGPNGISLLGKLCAVFLIPLGIAAFATVMIVPWIHDLLQMSQPANVRTCGLLLMVIQAIAGAAFIYLGMDIVTGWRGS